LVDYEQADLVMGQMATANGTAKQAVDLLQSEWARAAEGVTQAELDAVKTYLTGAYALRFDSNRAIAGVLVGMQMAGYDTGYPARRNAMIEAVTLDDIARVARRLYRPDALRFVVVGEPEGLVSTP
ncbi:MAG: M16 family metallopeptidase, partial [Gemmobacter sp.]